MIKAKDIIRLAKVLRCKYRKTVPLTEWVKGDSRLFAPKKKAGK